MANFDNGLPPANTDSTGKKVSNINIQRKEANHNSQQAVQAVNIEQREAKISNAASINSITYTANRVDGNNTVLFYL